MKYKDLLEGKIPSNIKAISAIEKFVNSNLSNARRYQEDEYYDYGNSRVNITNKYIGYIDFFGTIAKKTKESHDILVSITEKHVKIIGEEKVTDNSIEIELQLGEAPNAIYFSETITTFTASAIKKALKNLIEKAKKSDKGRIKVLANILRYKKPLSATEASKSTTMGHASMSSTNIEHSYDKVVYIKDLMKVFSESEFKAAIKEDYSLKKDNVSFNFKKGLMDRSGTWSETWD